MVAEVLSIPKQNPIVETELLDSTPEGEEDHSVRGLSLKKNLSVAGSICDNKDLVNVAFQN